MRKLYAFLVTDDSGNDLCLGDGLWLSVDGSLHDRGPVANINMFKPNPLRRSKSFERWPPGNHHG